MGVRYHFGFRVGQGVVNTRFSGDPNVGRLYGTNLPTFGWFRYPSVGESSVRRLIAAAALAAAASNYSNQMSQVPSPNQDSEKLTLQSWPGTRWLCCIPWSQVNDTLAYCSVIFRCWELSLAVGADELPTPWLADRHGLPVEDLGEIQCLHTWWHLLLTIMNEAWSIKSFRFRHMK